MSQTVTRTPARLRHPRCATDEFTPRGRADSDDCRNDCIPAVCGDGVIHALVETCNEDIGTVEKTDAAIEGSSAAALTRQDRFELLQ